MTTGKMGGTIELIIDLDRSDEFDDPEPPPHRTVGRFRSLAIAALVIACVAALAGAARPTPALTHLGDITWPHDAMSESIPPAFAAGLVMSVIGGEVLAHHPDGRLAWRSRPAIDIPDYGPRSTTLYPWEDSILLVGSVIRIMGSSARSAQITSVALDPATGRERWRIDGWPERVGDLIMVTRDAVDGSRGRGIYRGLPGDLLWTVPPARTMFADAATDTLMALTDEGIFTEYELSTGKPRRTARLALPQLDRVEEDQLTIGLFRDRLLLRAVKYSGPELAVKTLSYDRATLRPLAPSALDQFNSLQECGPVVCASSFDRTHVLDRDSLAELWQTQPGEFPNWTGDGLLIRSSPVRLLDERTGRSRVETSGWNAVYDLRRSFGERESGPILATRQVNERTYVARLTPKGIRVLGSIPHPVRICEFHEGLLVCGIGVDRTGIWRLNPA